MTAGEQEKKFFVHVPTSGSKLVATGQPKRQIT